jgi:hypothetical protein
MRIDAAPDTFMGAAFGAVCGRVQNPFGYSVAEQQRVTLHRLVAGSAAGGVAARGGAAAVAFGAGARRQQMAG